MALFNNQNNETMVATTAAKLMDTITRLLQLAEPLLKEADKQAREAIRRRAN